MPRIGLSFLAPPGATPQQKQNIMDNDPRFRQMADFYQWQSGQRGNNLLDRYRPQFENINQFQPSKPQQPRWMPARSRGGNVQQFGGGAYGNVYRPTEQQKASMTAYLAEQGRPSPFQQQQQGGGHGGALQQQQQGGGLTPWGTGGYQQNERGQLFGPDGQPMSYEGPGGGAGTPAIPQRPRPGWPGMPRPPVYGPGGGAGAPAIPQRPVAGVGGYVGGGNFIAGGQLYRNGLPVGQQPQQQVPIYQPQGGQQQGGGGSETFEQWQARRPEFNMMQGNAWGVDYNPQITKWYSERPGGRPQGGQPNSAGFITTGQGQSMQGWNPQTGARFSASRQRP